MPRPLPYRLRLLSALLALLVLGASVGLTAERHRCRISGRSTVALLLPGLAGHADGPGKGCGSQPPALAKRHSLGCCDISHVLHKLDAKRQTGSTAKWLPAPPKLLPAGLPAPTWVGQVAGAAPLATGVAVGTAGGPSPPGVPRAGRVLLAWVGVLVV